LQFSLFLDLYFLSLLFFFLFISSKIGKKTSFLFLISRILRKAIQKIKIKSEFKNERKKTFTEISFHSVFRNQKKVKIERRGSKTEHKSITREKESDSEKFSELFERNISLLCHENGFLIVMKSRRVMMALPFPSFFFFLKGHPFLHKTFIHLFV
jgi:hypothetical protein